MISVHIELVANAAEARTRFVDAFSIPLGAGHVAGMV